jgi:hypothetical protein
MPGLQRLSDALRNASIRHKFTFAVMLSNIAVLIMIVVLYGYSAFDAFRQTLLSRVEENVLTLAGNAIGIKNKDDLASINYARQQMRDMRRNISSSVRRCGRL